MTTRLLCATIFLVTCCSSVCRIGGTSANAADISPEVTDKLQAGLRDLQTKVDDLHQLPALQTPDGKLLIADVAVFAKAVDWMLRHNEFPKDNYAEQAATAIEIGLRRANELADGHPSWPLRTGTTIRGYVSRIDGSVQPYALTLPAGTGPHSTALWPLHVKLHGRANDMNEVNFIARNEGQPLPDGQTWIQLDVYGRGNNAYRWAGEVDVFEAIADVKRRFPVDDDRVTLHGFSMGGAGAWHLGLHYPDKWSSVGPGAGFVDFYRYQKQTERLPPWQHSTLGIYDAIDYAVNAFNVPICTYGGEEDSQLVASTSTVEAAQKAGVDIKLLIGAGMGHAFHPDSLREFMAFHATHTESGRRRGRSRPHIRFTTRTLKYNTCDWLTVEEVFAIYEPTTVDASLNDEGSAVITTENVAAMSLDRDISETVVLDGQLLPCRGAENGSLPTVTFRMSGEGWQVLNPEQSRQFHANTEVHKRHDLQGPIDDAFMDAFVCVKGTGEAANAAHNEWAEWTLSRFEREFDKWLRGRIRIVSDTELDDRTVAANHLVLFGDPSSNSVIRRVLPDLPIDWQARTITVGARTFDTENHGLSMIFPNPLNPAKYVVINSGHTMHEKDFQASNAWLFPRLGDIAVQRFSKNEAGEFDEEIVWAANFDGHWKLIPAGE